MSNALFPYLLLAPSLIFLSILIFYPLIRGFHLSTLHYVLTDPLNRDFVGLSNFAKMIEDPYFLPLLKQSAVWVTTSVFFQFVLGFALALLLNEEFFARGIYRAIILSPWAVAPVVVGIIWMWMFHGQIGVINDLLMRLGIIRERVPWLARIETALPSVIFANIWRGIAFFAIMLVAALQSIPIELYEAAGIDGAGAFKKFRYVTLPMIKPMVVVSVLLRVIWTFNSMDIIYVMTEGGPAFSSNTLATYTFLIAYKHLDFGYAGALSVFIFILLIVFTIVMFRTTGFEEGAVL
ncbi:MAG TPA: sugar ABC transporter permease [Spirochaetia bacterium]|nr:sugar ABC transporter permease [Spirochaetia bacterium]